MPTPDVPTPISPNLAPEALSEAYFRALGRFLHEYAQTENDLLFLLDRYATGIIADSYQSHIPPSKFVGRTADVTKVVRALVGSQRSAQIADTIKLLMRINLASEEDIKSMDSVLAQFGQIRSLRDRLMHTGALPLFERGKWVFRTWTYNEARERHKAHTIKFRIEDLEAMTADLWAIRLRSSAALVTEHSGAKSLAHDHGAYGPWRYKHIQPEVEGRTHPSRDREKAR